jgi:hypothetical protein
MNYDYIHGICYWEGNKRFFLIEQIVDKLKNTIHSNKKDLNLLCIISIRSNRIITNNEKDKFNLILDKQSDNVSIKIIYNFNWGGTVGALWDIYKYLENAKITSYIIGVWEDDAIFKQKYWFDKVESLLLKGYIYVGSLHETHNIKNQELYSKVNYKYNPSQVIVSVPNFKNNEVIWVEDPYILFFKNLKLIEDKIGCFTLAPKNKLYQYWEDGIVNGEVGFPTRLVNEGGFKIYGIPASRRMDDSFILFLDPWNKYSKCGGKTYRNKEEYLQELKKKGIIDS